MVLPRLLAVIVCSSMMALAPAAPAIANDSHVYSGKQIFEGVFFGRGPVAQRLPDFWASSSVASYRGTMESAYFGRALSTVEARIAKRDPGYFIRLQRDMTSGDPGLVQYAIGATQNEVAAIMPKRVAARGDILTPASFHGDGLDVDDIIVVVEVSLLVAVVPQKNLKTALQSPFNNDRAAALIAAALRS